MRVVPNKIKAFLAIFLSSSFAIAKQGPPNPEYIPPPPGLPLDGSLYVLITISLIYGLHKIYSIKKASN